MPLTAFDHINIRTGRLDEMIAWYGDVLDMHPGARPPFSFPGAWLYLGDEALIHLVGEDESPRAQDPGLEHFALRAEGFEAFMAHLESRKIPARVAEVPGIDVVQVNIHDPDGNHIHIDFKASERK